MPTTMNFALSATLRNHLTTGGAGNGVYAYAFAFEGANLIPGGAVTLVSNGVAGGAPSVALTTNSHTTFSSGKVYIVVQQTGHGGTSDLLSTPPVPGRHRQPRPRRQRRRDRHAAHQHVAGRGPEPGLQGARQRTRAAPTSTTTT
jgi:hypothetical protein